MINPALLPVNMKAITRSSGDGLNLQQQPRRYRLSPVHTRHLGIQRTRIFVSRPRKTSANKQVEAKNNTVKEYIRFRLNDKIHYGLLQGDRVSLLEGDLFAGPVVSDRQVELSQVQLLAPVLPGKAVCVGLNYRRHAEELGMKLPDEPIIFLKPSDALIGPDEAIVYWPTVGQLDYEAELAIVIGKAGRDIPEDEALDHVFGYTIANDVTARDLQRKDGQWTRAKGFDTFLPVGPAIVTEIDAGDLRLQAIHNGQVKQDSRTSDMIFNIPQMISFVSRVMTLYPGDLILTGTPSGIGPMQVGDTIEIVIEGLGRLSNTIAKP